MNRNLPLIVYAPVLHAGVLRLLDNYSGPLFLVDDQLARELSDVYEISALPVSIVRDFLSTKYPNRNIRVLSKDTIRILPPGKLMMVNDEVCRRFVSTYLPDHEIEWDTAFLRHDVGSVNSSVVFPTDQRMVLNSSLKRIVDLAFAEAEKSPCVWRQVGAVAFDEKGGILASAHNSYLPTEYSGYAQGEVRDFVPAGTSSQLTNSLHAEIALITECNEQRIRLSGADIYLTVAPCVPCALALASLKVGRLLFSSGHAYLGVDETLRMCGVETVFVELPENYRKKAPV